jgi:hypothetical protein
LRATGSLQLHHSRWQVMANVDAQAVGGEQFAVDRFLTGLIAPVRRRVLRS